MPYCLCWLRYLHHARRLRKHRVPQAPTRRSNPTATLYRSLRLLRATPLASLQYLRRPQSIHRLPNRRLRKNRPRQTPQKGQRRQPLRQPTTPERQSWSYRKKSLSSASSPRVKRWFARLSLRTAGVPISKSSQLCQAEDAPLWTFRKSCGLVRPARSKSKLRLAISQALTRNR